MTSLPSTRIYRSEGVFSLGSALMVSEVSEEQDGVLSTRIAIATIGQDAVLKEIYARYHGFGPDGLGVDDLHECLRHEAHAYLQHEIVDPIVSRAPVPHEFRAIRVVEAKHSDFWALAHSPKGLDCMRQLQRSISDKSLARYLELVLSVRKVGD